MSVSAVRQQIQIAKVDGALSPDEVFAIVQATKNNISKKELREISALLGLAKSGAVACDDPALTYLNDIATNKSLRHEDEGFFHMLGQALIGPFIVAYALIYVVFDRIGYSERPFVNALITAGKVSLIPFAIALAIAGAALSIAASPLSTVIAGTVFAANRLRD